MKAVSDNMLGDEEPGYGQFHTCSSPYLVQTKEKNYTLFSFSFGPFHVRADFLQRKRQLTVKTELLYEITG